MTIEQYLNRLCRNILNERFNWRKYLSTKSYFGRNLCVTPLHASYGQIGYHPKKMMRRKNKTPQTKNPGCLHIIIYVRILDFCFFATNSLIIGGTQTVRPFPLLPQFAHYCQMMQIAPCPSLPFSHLILKLQHPHSVVPSFPKTLRLFSA